MKETDWIPGNLKPVRVGVYKRDYSNGPGTDDENHFCWWNGESWGVPEYTPEHAKMHGGMRAVWQDLPWKGLAK